MRVSHRVDVVRCSRLVPNATARQFTMCLVFSKPVLQEATVDTRRVIYSLNSFCYFCNFVVGLVAEDVDGEV